MIIVNIKEGLGNQLFQYATAKRLSIKKNEVLKLYLHFFKENKQRSFKLLFFNINEEVSTDLELRKLTLDKRYFNNLNHKLYRVLQKLKPLNKRRVFYEKLWSRDIGVLSAGNNVFLDGYWANPIFFNDIREELLKSLTLRSEYITTEFKKILELINSSKNSVSIHIRRGDYASKKGANIFFGTLNQKYYTKAQSEIFSLIENPVFYVFSDDINWVKQNIVFKGEVNYIDNKLYDYHELILMSSCKHNVIANSTFSWWGAWLNSNESKVVIAPERWYNNEEAQSFYENNSFLPNNWIKL